MKKERISRIFKVGTLVCGAVTLILAVWAYLLPQWLLYRMGASFNGPGAIGVIGSADGPTSIFVSGSVNAGEMIIGFGMATLLGIIGIIYFKVKKMQSKT